MNNTYSGLSVFISVGGRMFKPEDLNITKIEIRDEDHGDSEVEFECIDDDYKIADSSLFRVGQVLSVKWGYTKGDMSEERTGYVIMKPATKYSKSGTISTVTASTKSAVLAARRPQKSYGPTSVRSLVSEIAVRNGLKAEITGGNEGLDGFAQGGWSDRQTLQVLADRFNYELSFTSESVIFAPRDYGSVPKLELVYGHGEEGNILDAHLNVDDKKKHGDTSSTAVSFNPFSKEAVTQQAEEANKSLAVSAETGSVSVATQNPQTPSKLSGFFTKAQDQVKSLLSMGTNGVVKGWDFSKTFSTPDFKNALAHATSDKLGKQKKKGEFSVTTIGMVRARIRTLVHVSGVAKRDSGNWYVSAVRQVIDLNDGYTTEWELNRHGSNSQGGEKTKSPLNTQLPPTKDHSAVVTVSAESGKVK